MKNIIYICFVFFAFFHAINCNAQSGKISTIAGTGTSGYFGDGGAAIMANINYARGIAIDSIGNIYFADRINHCVRKINTSGTISTIAGNGTVGNTGDGGFAIYAKLNTPVGIAIDKNYNIYITDDGNNNIRKINPSNVITTIAGSHDGSSGFSGDGNPASLAQLNQPSGITTDADGNIYIADCFNQRIRKINSAGIINTIAGDGLAGFKGNYGPAVNARINFPTDVALDKNGNLYIADQMNHQIRIVNTDGTINTFAGNGVYGYGGDGGDATAANLNQPTGISIDTAGNVYVADASNNCIRKIFATGIICTYAGTTVSGYNGDGIKGQLAKLNSPTNVFVVQNGDLYVSDFGNLRIRKVMPIPAGINNLLTGKTPFTIYPNPIGAELFISTDNSVFTTFRITNALGENIITENINTNISKINTSKLSNGVYTITLYGKADKIAKQFIKI